VAVIAGAVAVALAAALVVALIDDGSDEPRSQTTSTAPPASFPSSTADTDAAAPAPSPTPTVAPTTEPPAGSVLEDGRHAVFLTGLDVDARTVDFDVIQFLMGDEATAAYHEDHPEDPDAPPNDYYIVNDNPRCVSCRSTRTSRSSFWTPSSRRRSPSRICRPGWRATWCPTISGSGTTPSG
jgi:hypothetical protein